MKNNIKKLYLFNFFISMQLISGVIIPFFTIWGGLSMLQVVILQSFYSLCIFLFEIPSGAFADTVGRKRAMGLAVLMGIAGAVLYASRPDFLVFIFAELLLAIGASLMSGSENAIVYDTLRKTGKQRKSKTVFSRYETSGLLGLMIGAPLGGLIASFAGLNAPWIYLTIPLSAAFIISLTLKEPSFRKRKANYISTMIGGVKYFLGHKILKVLAFDMISISLVSYFLFIFYQKMLLNSGMEIGHLGFVFSGIMLAQVAVMNSFSRLDKICGSRRKYIFISAVISGVALMVASLTNFLPIVILGIVISIGFGQSRMVLFTSYFNKHIPSDKRATVLSSISMVRRLSIAAVGPLVGIVADMSFTTVLVILGLSAIVFSFVSRVEEDMLID